MRCPTFHICLLARRHIFFIRVSSVSDNHFSCTQKSYGRNWHITIKNVHFFHFRIKDHCDGYSYIHITYTEENIKHLLDSFWVVRLRPPAQIYFCSDYRINFGSWKKKDNSNKIHSLNLFACANYTALCVVLHPLYISYILTYANSLVAFYNVKIFALNLHKRKKSRWRKTEADISGFRVYTKCLLARVNTF